MKIIKSLRKSITLKIDEAWKVVVNAPIFASKKTIEDFLEKNKTWVAEKTEQVMERIKEFREWEKFYFFWDECELKFDNESEKMTFDWMNLYLKKAHKDIVREKLIEFYKYEAKKFISVRIKEIAEVNNLEFNGLRITSAKTRWGSCTSKRNINFTYRLIMAPVRVIDYVIIHELAHLNEMNHSKKFWETVDAFSKKMYPWDYKIQKKWLTDNGNKLMY